MSKQTKKPLDEELEQEEVLEEETVETEAAEAAEAVEEPAEEPSDDLANLQKALEEEQNRYLRLMAEYDNFRKRSAREKDGIYTDAKADTFTSLLPVLD
ncbi:MAG: nucleotide exchange factor GrpE, partial [Acutalibacteraceae bacterium]|nr:nucleotide exchange factor GrpE [Acutalibacteraceae bacterium]